jgi:hypothetical protein
MLHLHPGFRCSCERRPEGTVLVCRGEVRPTALNDAYRVRIEYRAGRRPQVWVESPKLARRKPDERIPHTFADDRPCLFKYDFASNMLLARTIVPWLLMWLFFYECWRVTGEWRGGGLHPGEDQDEDDRLMESA